MSNCIKYWLKLIQMSDSRYPKQCYYMLKRLDEAGRKTWATNIRELLYVYDFGYIWLAYDVGNDVFL